MKKLFLSVILMAFLPGLCTPVFATVSSTTNKVIYTGDGSSSTFSFSFNVYLSSDLVVQKVLISTGVATTLTLNADYTVTLTHAIPTPGSVTLTAGALASTYQLVILRTLPLTQLINITNPYYSTPAATWNEAHDRATMLAQQLQEQLNRGIIGPSTSSTQLELPTGVAGECLGWDGTGTELANLTCSGGSGGGGGSNFNPPIDDSNLQAITTANKVSGAAIYSLSSLPAGAGVIPAANINVGTGASQIVQFTATPKYPAVDGSLITNISGVNFTGLASIPSGAGLIPAANLPAVTQAFVPNNCQSFSTPGAATWTKPANISTVYLRMWGSGGGGAGGDSNATGGGGAGGGAGGYTEGPVAVTSNVTVTIGAGGTAGAAQAGGGNGGTTSFAGTTTPSIAGGTGGANGAGTGVPAVGGAGGVASVGSVNINGAGGMAGGLDTATITGGRGGNGGSTAFGTGGTGNGDPSDGLIGTGFGAGGGGGAAAATGKLGGAGTGGLAIVCY